MFRKFLAVVGTAVLALGLSALAVAAPASATQPTVTGVVSCNTTTGNFDITWRVTGDTGSPSATATILTAAITSTVAGQPLLTTTSLIARTVTNTGYVEVVQPGATVGPQYQMTVMVQWSNHPADLPVAQISSYVVPTGSCAVIPTDRVDCSAITFVKGTPLDGSNYINASFIQNGMQFQMNAEINPVQQGDPASASGFFVLVHAPTGDVKYPLTVTERDSGIFTFHYSAYLQNQWTVHWIQYDGHADHYLGDLSCGIPLVAPTVAYELGACYQTGTIPNLISSSILTLIFDNSASTVPVIFSVPNALDVGSSVSPTPSIVRTVLQGQIVRVQTSAVRNAGASYDVVMNGSQGVTIPNGTITVTSYSGCPTSRPGDPTHSNETCTLSGKALGSITVGLEAGLIYSIDGPGVAYDVSPVTTRITTGLPAGHYIVSVVAAPGYALSGAGTWPLSITILGTDCGQLETHPLVTPTARSTPASCVAPGTYTLDSNAGVLWSVNGVPANAGTYRVNTASTVQVSASPNSPNYGFDSGIPTPKTFTFSFTQRDPATCGSQLTTLAHTGVKSSLWLILAGGLMFLGIGGMFIARQRWVRGN